MVDINATAYGFDEACDLIDLLREKIADLEKRLEVRIVNKDKPETWPVGDGRVVLWFHWREPGTWPTQSALGFIRDSSDPDLRPMAWMYVPLVEGAMP